MNNKKIDYMSDIFFYQGTTNLLKDIKEKESIDESLSDLQLQEIRKRITEFFYKKNRHKAQRKAKFYINKCRSASCMQGGLKQASA